MTAVLAIVMFRLTVLVWLLSVDISRSAPTDEFRAMVSDGELSMSDDGPLMGIVPGGYSTQGSEKSQNIYSDFLQYNEFNKTFSKYMQTGVTMKNLTFNIFDENMKEATSNLFELIHSAEKAGINTDKLINFDELNEDLVSYVTHLNMLYYSRNARITSFLPPFIEKPNFFVNGETIIKALKLSHSMNTNNLDEARADHSYKNRDTIIINTNYSGWNLPQNGGDEELTYFREDISLNSYYYGVHLMHPYWMFRHKLYTMNARHDEHYYFIHQQLAARLYLEKEHLKQKSNTSKKPNLGGFNPYLIHDNGLPFPTRMPSGDWSDDRAKIKAIDIAINECMSRGIIVMQNTDPVTLTENNYIYLLTKLIRANFEVGKVGKIVRSLFGYGGNGYPYNEYDPAPSLLHHPQTSLRDPIYWYMIQYALNYFTEYKASIDRLYIRLHSTKYFDIVKADIPEITTYFDYYQFNINRAISKNDWSHSKTPLTITARQKRLKHSKFEITFTIQCKSTTDGIVRLFIGPQCVDDCWNEYSNFFELDKFIYPFDEGLNTVSWSPDTSNRLSNDEYYNLEGGSKKNRTNKYNMYKFPENLIIPRGLEKGLNLTLFIMVTPPDDEEDDETTAYNIYSDINHHVDRKPLGFPFNRPAMDYDDDAPNYKFYNITIYHTKNKVVKDGYFSPILD